MAQTTAQGRSGKVTWHTLGVAACLLIGAILRLYRLDAQSLWSDEGIQYAVASADSIGGVIERMKGSTMHPPLSFLINHLFLQIRDTDFLLRLPSALLASPACRFSICWPGNSRRQRRPCSPCWRWRFRPSTSGTAKRRECMRASCLRPCSTPYFC